MRAAGLFAGIGGIEEGLSLSELDVETTLLCESWGPAQRVLAEHFDVEVAPDVRTLGSLPDEVELVTAGFPCTDLSQAGRTAGIGGEQSGLVSHVFDLLEERAARRRAVTWLVVENVPNMLALDRGEAMAYLVERMADLDLRWAYRVVDSRFTGVPQRRRRVILVASPTEDPSGVLFSEEAGCPGDERYSKDAFGFYSTEGLRGLGWAQDAVPTLKAGSTIGIPSPPAVWVPGAPLGRQLVVPSIEEAEQLQGFGRGWTRPGADGERREGVRWKLVGNAVTVGVARWLGDQLAHPGVCSLPEQLWNRTGTWPLAAHGEGEKVWAVPASEYPVLAGYRHLDEVLDTGRDRPLSHRAAAGFLSRLEKGSLGRHPGFREAVAAHVEATAEAGRSRRLPGFDWPAA